MTAPTDREALTELVAVVELERSHGCDGDRANAALKAAREALSHPEPDVAALVERLRDEAFKLRNMLATTSNERARLMYEAAAALESPRGAACDRIASRRGRQARQR